MTEEKKKIPELFELRKKYEGKVEKVLEKRPERRKEFRTGGNLPLNRVYDPTDLEEFDYARDLNYPGQYPL